jgi:hypothetical protein
MKQDDVLEEAKQEAFQQELSRLAFGGLAGRRLHGFVGRDLDVLRVPNDVWRVDVRSVMNARRFTRSPRRRR